jgi:hypothetical protein
MLHGMTAANTAIAAAPLTLMRRKALLALPTLALCWIATLGLLTPPAKADTGYRPSITWLQRVDEVHAHPGGASTHTVQMLRRIERGVGVDSHAEQRVEFNVSLQTLEVLEAWTETPQGQRLAVADKRAKAT